MKTTKELAKELGIFRRRSSHHEEKWKKVKTGQIFSHLIIIDFESTCWDDAKSRKPEITGKTKFSEVWLDGVDCNGVTLKHGVAKIKQIIEFPAVLLNTSNGEIESEFHSYLQPMENSILSEFCKELTGITQSQVDQGIPLGLCLNRFTRWLKKVAEDKGLIFDKSDSPENRNKCTFVTWSDWDLGVCLRYECQRKQLRKPPELNTWIDCRAVYKRFYGRKPQGLRGSLKDLGIEFEGREHSGLQDSRNTAALVWRMIRDGCKFEVTTSLSGMQRKTREFSCQSMFLKSDGGQAKAEQCDDEINKNNINSCSDENHVASQRQQLSTIDNVSMSLVNPIGENISVIESKRVCNISSFITKRLPLSTICKNNGNSANIKTENTKECVKTGISPGTLGIAQSSPRVLDRTHFSSKFKTPISTDRKNISSVFKTPYGTPYGNSKLLKPTSMNITPPMCQCGRRSKRKTVQTVGENLGRTFFCCSSGRSSSRLNTLHNAGGCGFFKWEGSTASSRTRLKQSRYSPRSGPL